ncbi:hypothetical protein [Synechococcus sp. PCC 6312]|uniref:hypothetical protein n=1 Tax=Synechococcus sp. (strain ATCC 27167 / PCC 6312) TaxID=195253 RepID=UPI00029F1FEE|nr:hypothetical protein [Synechococcus sp. PCC 6312]AFY61239.1 hypothetical protein Syn6312_2119 [Synechococcus sp. PCC 6312]
MEITAIAREREGILSGMAQIALLGGTRTLTPADISSLQACSHYLFQTELPDWHQLPPILPQQLAQRLPDPHQRELALQLLTVMAFVDGVVDEAKINLVLTYADALNVHADYIQDLVATTRRHWAWILADMSQRNIESIMGQPWAGGDITDWLLPYQQTTAPTLVARFQALATLPTDTLGYQFWEFYQAQGYAFPGESSGLNAKFAIPHDCTHLFAGYDTSPAGEILVSTFTAAMHRQKPMGGHILPVIYSWHLGIAFNDVAGSAQGALHPKEFWQAWALGNDTAIDLFDPAWDFWVVTSMPLAKLQAMYKISGL